MLKTKLFPLVGYSLSLFFGVVTGSINAAVSPDLIAKTDASIETLRNRNCTVTITLNGQTLSGQPVQVIQLHNDFGFGGTIHTVGFNMSDSAMYIDLFPKLFDWAVPENEMKWPNTDRAPDTINFTEADRLINWCLARGIKVRGHNLFWNEDVRWLPTWALTLTPVEFKAAMARRIDTAMTHFKGRVAHWDIINELIHYPQATHGTPEVTLFDSATADPDIFRWVLNRARKIDPVAKFTINEYAILEDLDATPTTFAIYKDKMNRLLTDSSSFDIVGLEGHFGGSIVQEKYASNLDKVTAAIPKPIWLTEVDWSVFEEVPDRMEEMMRSAFAHPNVGGLMLWSWWEARLWRSDMTSTLADGICFPTEAGLRWMEMREKWKTKKVLTTNATGQIDFRGFQGEYVAVHRIGAKTYAGRFYIEPGTAAKSITLALKDTLVTDSIVTAGIEAKALKASVAQMRINGQQIHCNFKTKAGDQLYLYTYSMAGRLLSKLPVTDLQNITTNKTVAGCSVIGLGTRTQILYTGKLMHLR